MYSRRFIGSIGLLMVLALAGCGGATATNTTTNTNTNSNEGTSASLRVSADPSGQLKFLPATLDAPADQPITVTFTNPVALEHNWVLVAPGQEQTVVNEAASKGGDPTGISGVLAQGTILGLNGEETINVPPQAAGTYPYICTVLGHYAGGMKGTLTVK